MLKKALLLFVLTFAVAAPTIHAAIQSQWPLPPCLPCNGDGN
jgi:hypothetical protein